MSITARRSRSQWLLSQPAMEAHHGTRLVLACAQRLLAAQEPALPRFEHCMGMLIM